jgi:hypothetical protein
MRSRTCVRAAMLCALAATAAVPASASAAPHPVHDDGLTIAATPDPTIAGAGVLIYGQLSGSDLADQPIHLYHRIDPAARFTLISTTRTNAEGFYEFTRAEGVVVSNRNWYVTGPDATHSATIHERVAAILTLTASSSATTTGTPVRFSGSVFPAHANQMVDLQEQDSTTGSGWRTIAQGRTNAASAFNISHAFRLAGDDTLRAYLPGDDRNTAGSSDAVTLAVQQTQNPAFTITTSAPEITVGSPATISGTLYASGSTSVPAVAVAVNLYGKTVGGHFKELGTTVTGTDGSYSFLQAPVNNMVYKVETSAAAGDHSANLYQAVGDTVSLSASASSATVGTAVGFSGTVTPDHAGHAIYLQVLTAKGGWQDVASQSVSPGSRYAFSYRFGQPGTYTVRARIFGGPENVGAGSPTVTVTVAGDAPASTLPAAS